MPNANPFKGAATLWVTGGLVALVMRGAVPVALLLLPVCLVLLSLFNSEPE